MGNEVANYDKAWAEEAKRHADRERVESSTISHRGGQFKCGDLEFPELCVIIVADLYENAYYTGKFDSEELTPPVCYAFHEEEEELAPHPSMQNSPEYFKPQNADCPSCPFNQWNSADTGRGKACKNIRRLAVLPAGVYSPRKGSRDLDLDVYITDDHEENVEHIMHAEAYMIKVPPTSVRGYKQFVQTCSAEYNRPPAGIIARIYTEPMANGGHRLVFEPLEELPVDLYPAVTARRETAAATLIKPYSPPDGNDAPREAGTAPEKAQTARGRLKKFGKKKGR